MIEIPLKGIWIKVKSRSVASSGLFPIRRVTIKGLGGLIFIPHFEQGNLWDIKKSTWQPSGLQTLLSSA